nr:hypothetical protein Iba_scaffold42275CG0010 [Ipomoea batatas]
MRCFDPFFRTFDALKSHQPPPELNHRYRQQPPAETAATTSTSAAAIAEEVLHHVATPPATAYGSNSTFSFRMAIKMPNVFQLAPSQPRCAPGRR